MVTFAGTGGNFLSFAGAKFAAGTAFAELGSFFAPEVDLEFANTSSARALLSFGAVSTLLPPGLAVLEKGKLDCLSVAIEKSSSDGNLLARSSTACALTFKDEESRAANGSPLVADGACLAAVAGCEDDVGLPRRIGCMSGKA